jgi:hypothetical protein
MAQEAQLDKRKSSLLAAIQNDVVANGSSSQRAAIQSGKEGAISPQQRGNLARDVYVQRLSREGIVLHRVVAKRYRTPSGIEVGIAYASELKDKPDAWFLGLADEHFDAVVLLCETESGQTLDFVLPPKFVAEIWSPALLSRNNKQVKFHVFKRGSTYELQLRGGRMMPINQYVEGRSCLK